jgi:hypothetical protein
MASKVAGESDQKRPLHSEVERMTNNFMVRAWCTRVPVNYV